MKEIWGMPSSRIILNNFFSFPLFFLWQLYFYQVFNNSYGVLSRTINFFCALNLLVFIENKQCYMSLSLSIKYYTKGRKLSCYLCYEHLQNRLPWLGHTYVTVAKIGSVGHLRSHLIYRVYIRLHRSCKICQLYHRLHRQNMCKYYSLWWCQRFDSFLSWWQ